MAVPETVILPTPLVLASVESSEDKLVCALLDGLVVAEDCCKEVAKVKVVVAVVSEGGCCPFSTVARPRISLAILFKGSKGSIRSRGCE